MKTILASALAICMLSIHSQSFAQCGPIYENFNTSGNGNAGFSGTIASGSFGWGSSAVNFTAINGATVNCTLKTPVLSLSFIATTIDYGFTLTIGSKATISGLTVSVQYVNTADQVVTTAPVSISSISPICGSIAKPANMITVGASARLYQLVFSFTSSGNGNVNSFLTMDDYRTSSTSSLIILPVRFTSFSVKSFKNSAALNWSVDALESMTAFQVQRSIDGNSFSTIAEVKMTIEKTYAYNDDQPVNGNSFYRIKTTDKAGAFIYSAAVALKKGEMVGMVKAFPTITSGKIIIQHPEVLTPATITVNSSNGQVVKTIIPAIASGQTVVDFSALKPGMYIVQFVNANAAETFKIIKQ